MTKNKIKESDYEQTKCPVCLGVGSISPRGEIFKAAREVCRLSRQDLADCIGVSHVTIRNIEQGLTRPQRGTLELLLEEFKSRNVELDISVLSKDLQVERIKLGGSGEHI